MLSRVVDNLYWMSRYLERAEHTARLLDVNLHAVLDQTPQSRDARWVRLARSLRVPIPGSEDGDVPTIVRALTFDASNPTSILSCLSEARDNARQAWEQISSEMWEHLNRLFLDMNGRTLDDIWSGDTHALFTTVKDGTHLFQGVTDGTMIHSEGWHFIQVGRGLERATATAALLDAYFVFQPTTQEGLDFLEWLGLLKSCGAFEAYVKIYSPEVDPYRIAELLLLNAEFPRSVRFVTSAVRSGLQAIGRSTGHRGAGRADRVAGRLQAALEYSQIDEILAGDLHDYLEHISQGCDQIHAAINGTYIRYPVAPALAAERR